MGREIIVQARHNDKVIYDDFVCGRDDATGYIASLVSDYCEKNNLDTCEISYNVNSSKDMEDLFKVRESLEEYAKKDRREIDKAKTCLEDLGCARRNARTLNDFDEFSERYEETEQWIEENDYSRADIIIGMLDKASSELATEINLVKSSMQLRDTYDFDEFHRISVPGKFEIIIIWSE